MSDKPSAAWYVAPIFLGYSYENGISLLKNNNIKHNRGLFILNKVKK